MLSARKTWPARMVAAVMTLALVFACTVGTYSHYGHAASHRHGDAVHSHHHGNTVHSQPHGPHAVHSGGVEEHAAVGAEHAHPADEHAVPDSANAVSDCSEPICHGGLAILVAAPIMSHPLGSELGIPPMAARCDAQHSRLERPPKSSADA